MVIEVPNIEATSSSSSRRFHFAHLYNFNMPVLKTLGRKAGLAVLQSDVSADSANLTIVFQKRDEPKPLSEENTRQLRLALSALTRHRPLRYGLSPGTWARPARRLARFIMESTAVWRQPSFRVLLDEAVGSR
jgi:hypothetical protein